MDILCKHISILKTLIIEVAVQRMLVVESFLEIGSSFWNAHLFFKKKHQLHLCQLGGDRCSAVNRVCGVLKALHIFYTHLANCCSEWYSCWVVSFRK